MDNIVPRNCNWSKIDEVGSVSNDSQSDFRGNTSKNRRFSQEIGVDSEFQTDKSIYFKGQEIKAIHLSTKKMSMIMDSSK